MLGLVGKHMAASMPSFSPEMTSDALASPRCKIPFSHPRPANQFPRNGVYAFAVIDPDLCFGSANLLYSRKITAVPSMIAPNAAHIRSGRCISRASLP